MVKVKFLLKVVPIVAVFAIILAGCEKNNPPNTPSNPSPSNGATDQPTSLITLSWTGGDPDGDSVKYTLFFGPSTNPPLKDSGLTSVTYLIDSLLKNTTYYWKVRAEDEHDAVVDGPVWNFKTFPDHPPNTPSTPSGPSSGIAGDSYTFSSNANDPDGDSMAIMFDWGDGTTSGWSSFISSGQTVEMSHSWVWAVTNKTWYIKAKAKDSKGAESDWSSPIVITIPGGEGTVKWRYQTGRDVSSSPAIGSDGTIYVGSCDYYLYALYPNGILKWRYQTGRDVTSSPAISSNGTVYVGSWDDYLYAINPDGTLKWRYLTGGIVYSSPAIGSDGTVYVGSEDGYLYALNSDGTLKWRYQTVGGLCSSPAIGSDGTIYVGAGGLLAIRSNGTLLWFYQIVGDSYSSPAIDAEGNIYIGINQDLYAFSSNGSLWWFYQTGDLVYSSPSIDADGSICVGSVDGNLYAISYGYLGWCYQTYFGIWTSPAIGSDGTVYSGDQNLYAISHNGILKWSSPYGWMSSPVIGVDGSIYKGDDDGCLYAIQGSGTLANTPWPMFRHDLKHSGRVGGP